MCGTHRAYMLGGVCDGLTVSLPRSPGLPPDLTASHSWLLHLGGGRSQGSFCHVLQPATVWKIHQIISAQSFQQFPAGLMQGCFKNSMDPQTLRACHSLVRLGPQTPFHLLVLGLHLPGHDTRLSGGLSACTATKPSAD